MYQSSSNKRKRILIGGLKSALPVRERHHKSDYDPKVWLGRLPHSQGALVNTVLATSFYKGWLLAGLYCSCMLCFPCFGDMCVVGAEGGRTKVIA